MFESSSYIKEDEIIDSIQSLNSSKADEIFLKYAKETTKLITLFLQSQNANKDNFEDLINKYYFPIINKILDKIPNFIDKKKYNYNNDFIIILEQLYDSIYLIFSKMKSILEENKCKEIVEKFFKNYNIHSYELLTIISPKDEDLSKKNGNDNPIICFNDKEKCININAMKSKILQYFSFIIQILFPKKEINNNINNDNLLIYINKINNLIINSLEDIVNNKDKYNLIIKKYGFEKNKDFKELDCYNKLLFQMIVFLSRSLLREPIKNDFSSKIKFFLINVLFPLNKTNEEEELNFMKKNPNEYKEYLDEISCNLQSRNCRTSISFLIKKIGENYDNIVGFILLFNIEMLNFIINEGKISKDLMEYNIYLLNIKDSKIKEFDNDSKLDLSLLIILILKDILKEYYYYLNRLLNILNDNYEKLNSIKNPLIKIKISKIFNFYLDIYYTKIERYEQDEINIKFIENIWNFSINNIIQNVFQEKEKYIQALCDGSSETLIKLLDLTQEEKIKIFVLENIEKNLIIFNALIDIIDIEVFYLLIEKIVYEIKIEQRNLLFECLNIIKKKIFGNKNEKFYNKYFIILRGFLIGINKIDKSDIEEIQMFKDIFEEIINNIQILNPFELYINEFLSTTIEYIKLLGGINEKCIHVLYNLVINNNDIEPIYNFLSSFISNIQNNYSNAQFDNNILFNEINIFIKKIFSTDNDNNSDTNYNLQFALLLTLEEFNLKPNFIEEFIDIIFNLCKNSKEQKNKKIPQLVLANIALGFIKDPETTFKILNTKSNFQLFSKFDLYIDLLLIIIYFKYPDYNIILAKCILLGIGGILNNKTCLDFLNNNKEKKIILIRNFFYLINNYIYQKQNYLKYLMKKDIKCQFIDEEEEEELIEEEEIIDFNEKVEKIFKENKNILNCDELKIFFEIMKNIKENDIETYNEVIFQQLKSNIEKFEEIYKYRNIKILYEQREYFTPRKILKIKIKNTI